MALTTRGKLPEIRQRGDFDDLRNRMLRLFEQPFSLPVYRETLGFVPAVEISETDGRILITAELPGLAAEDVDIELENNILTLRGEKKEAREDSEKDMYVYERSYGSFQRSFSLPTPVQEDQVTAEFQNGILRITLPKTEQAKGKKISIT
jgi:HSP20 family protein